LSKHGDSIAQNDNDDDNDKK